ncbi:hypothetical protein [Actinomadura yumaensis]|uniref:Uncharacterized protein n=1 Tax=Actinomadura yumaensis TaxID=111807 RepID=A0ABW2CAK4_9ACTN
MGAEPWTYFVPFQEDIAAAMSALREREFADVLQSTDWPDEWRRPTSIEDYRNLLDETASNDNGILELDDRLIGPGGEDEYRAVRLLASEEVRIFFGTDRPTRNDFERTYASASTGRHYNAFPSQPSPCPPDCPHALHPTEGHCARCTVLHDPEGRPTEIVFWGSSGD